MRSPPAAPRRRRWRLLLLLLGTTAALSAGIFLLALHAMEPPRVSDATLGGGSVGTRDGIAIALLTGDPVQCGTQAGSLLRQRLLATLRITRARRSFHLAPEERTALMKGLSADHAAELAAIVASAGVDADAAYDANLALDTQCTVLLTGADGRGPVRLARNMDFFPAQVLGPSTVVTVWRIPGKRAVCGIGWPGYAGVVATVLKNGRHRQLGGTPLAFRVREVLETASDLDTAVAAFQRSPVSSDHFIVLADARRACVVWFDGAWRRRDPVAGVLTCSNGRPDDQGDQDDDRTRALRALVANGAAGDETRLKQALTRVYLRDINAQAMLFRPELREVDLALATTFTPASKAPYHRLALGPWLAGGALDSVQPTEVGTVGALSHY